MDNEMQNVLGDTVGVVPQNATEAQAPVPTAPVATPTVTIGAGETAEAKVDHRKGPRKVVNADGTVSYGNKADGTPRKKPGRPAKTATAA